jgi:glycosyltransferase involved in cell wall biosynthesis
VNCTPPPFVSVLLAAHNAAAYLETAVRSVLAQIFDDLELIVVEDGSSDETPAILDRFDDVRLRVLGNPERLGLARSLNRGLAEARGRYVARLDADDIAMPDRIMRQVAVLRERPGLGAIGSAALDIDFRGRPGTLHVPPVGPAAVRWRALFGSPLFHPAAVINRELLDRHDLRYDPSFAESEDYDLWARLLSIADADNLGDVLVLVRNHPLQASRKRQELQERFQRQIAMREIRNVAPGFSFADAELAWRVGARKPIEVGRMVEAAGLFVQLLHRFEAVHGSERAPRRAAAASLLRLARSVDAGLQPRVGLLALELDPAAPVGLAIRRRRRRAAERTVRQPAATWIATLHEAGGTPACTRVAGVFPEPTPYRAQLFDRIAAREEVDLLVLYAARTVARRTWDVPLAHPHVILQGVRVPGIAPVLRHDYPITPGIWRALARSRPECVVISGWSTFASQAAIVWCRFSRTPYVLVVESHDRDPRPGWRRLVKGAVVPRLVRAAAGILVAGTLARESMLARGADPAHVDVFANTIDVAALAARADELAARRAALRASFGVGESDVVVLCAARLAPEKGIDVLVDALAGLGRHGIVLLLAGDGPERRAIEQRAKARRVRALMPGALGGDRLVEAYVAADVFALLSRNEPWGVVVNEAAACGLPLVLSERVGAAYDLLRPGQNGAFVPVDDATAAAEALRPLVSSQEERVRAGRASRAIVDGWGYERSVESFVASVTRAAVH